MKNPNVERRATAERDNPLLTDRLRRWQADLAALVIPAEIRAKCGGGSAKVGRRLPDEPAVPVVPTGSLSFERTWEALDESGSVIDVGAGTGDASLVLAPRMLNLTAVDASAEQLEALERRARGIGVAARTVHGRWPDVAAQVAPAELVVCQHVLYDVADLEPFVGALTWHARHRVVVTLAVRPPQAALNPLWEHFHGLSRPDRPTAWDVVEIVEAMGLRPTAETWIDVDGFGGYQDFDEMVDRTTRRLCLPAARRDEVASRLVTLGVDPSAPKSLGTVGREIATIWWEGTAG
jgi:SAM-dependent methyltransferase